MKKRLKSGEKIWGIDKLGDECLIVQFREHGPWCKGGCLQEGGCSGMFFNSDIDGGTVREVYEHPAQFVLERDSLGEPLGIRKLEMNE